MVSSGVLHRVALVRTDVSQELSASLIRATRIGELGTTLAVTSNRRILRRNTTWSASVVSYCSRSQLADSFHYDDGGVMFLQNVDPYKNHMASHPRRQHS
jgi:hypothetical protein